VDQLKITKYEQNCITIEVGAETYVLDAGSETSMDKLLSSERPSATFVSHSHPDHFNVDNLKSLSCPIFGSKEVVESLKAKDISATELLPDVTTSIGKINVIPFTVDHGDISVPIVNLGFHVESHEKSILFLGDIAIPSPIFHSKYDVVLIPVGGGKVFDVDQALEFIKSLQFKGTVIPMHFHGKADREDALRFEKAAIPYCNPAILNVGDSINL
jgi:L-ascorbate metabolism protein UlaG (beta-lactamase superfamily)